MPKTVRDIIKDRKEVYCISNQTTVAEAARFLKDRGIRATGVCNLSGKIVGVVSQSDISDKVVAEKEDIEDATRFVAKEVDEFIERGMTLLEPAQLMRSK